MVANEAGAAARGAGIMSRSRRLGMGPRPQIAAWIHHHRQASSDSLQKLMLEPISTILTWLVVGIALALPGSLLVMLDNVERMAAELETPARLSLLLKDGVGGEQAQALASGLEARVDIGHVTFVSRDKALQEFAADTGLEALAEAITTNPLPHTLLIYPAPDLTAERLEQLSEALAEQNDVAEVVFDTRWLSRLENALEVGRRLVIGLGILMLVGAVLILGNTIRLAIEARRAEIVVVKLIGGSNAFTRRPFLYTGLWFGIGGGVMGAVLVTVFFLFLAEPANTLLALYDSRTEFGGLGPVGFLRLVLVGGALGLVSAWQTTSLHLKQVEPR